MNLSDFHRFLLELLQGEPHVVAAFVSGILFTLLLIALAWYWLLRGRVSHEAEKAKQELQTEQAKSAALTRMIDEKEIRVRELSLACEKAKEQLAEVDGQRQEADVVRTEAAQKHEHFRKKAIVLYSRVKKQVDQLTAQLREVEDLQGKIWEQPAKLAVAPFRPLAERRVPIIATFNLKGGVGKTSLTAHLGAAMWAAGKKVLLIDLDYQASLTNLVLSREQVSDLNHGGKHVQRILTGTTMAGREVWDVLSPIGDTGSYLIGAYEELGRIEEKIKAEWLTGGAKREPRYLLRAALHDDSIAQKFDYILIDCPPRLTVASINALAASDFVLLPTLFDRTSSDAVSRLLELLKHLIDRQVCPDLRVLGIVANKSHCRPRLTAKEKTAWARILRDAKDAWRATIHGFKRHFPDSKAFAEAAEFRVLADRQSVLKPLFKDLADDIEKQILKRKSDHEPESARPAALRR